MCDCNNIDVGSHDNTMVVDIPKHMEGYRNARIKAGLSDTISLDKCIASEIFSLWDKGVITYGSCCGHNQAESMVNVADQHIQVMLDLGYIQNHRDPRRKDTFRLKELNSKD